MDHMQNEKKIFVQKQLISKSIFQKLVILQKYHLFWLNYDFFSNLCEGWSKNKGSLKHPCEDSIYLILRHLHLALLYYLLIPI